MKWLRRLFAVVVVAPVLVAAGAAVQARQDAPRTPEDICAEATQDLAEPETREFDQAEDVLKEGVDYWAVICTESGPIYLDLYEKEAPITVNNFVFLAEQGYYNNTTFHRVLPGFMAQGGDPTGTGSGGPGYEFEDETDNGLVFDQVGLLAMANAGPGTNGSQFFITTVLTSWLDGNHTIFGKVYQGIDVAELLTPRDPQQSPAFEGASLDTVVIIEDPATVDATPDGPPSLDHFEAMLRKTVAERINTAFSVQEDTSHTYTADEDAASYLDAGGQELVDFLTAYLAEHGLVGSARLDLLITECPAAPEDLPIWGLGFQVADYGSADGSRAVVFDDARSEMLVDSGVFTEFSDAADVEGRVYSAPATDQACGDTGMFYRLEQPAGRYVLTVDLIVDNTIINGDSETTAEQYLGFVMQDLLQSSISGTVDRGNAALE